MSRRSLNSAKVARAVVLTLVLLSMKVSLSAAQGSPYSLDQVVRLLRAGVPQTRILALLQVDCVSFRPSDQVNRVLAEAGADGAFLAGIRTLCVKRPQDEPRPKPPRNPPPERFGHGMMLAVWGSNAFEPRCCKERPAQPLSGTVDYSSDPSKVHPSYLSAASSNPVYAMGIGLRPRRSGIVLSVQYYFYSRSYAGGMSLGIQPFLPVGSSGVRIQPAIALRADYMQIPIGDVGVGESDGEYVSPFGEIVPAPATILAEGALVGAEASLGISFNFSPRFAMFGEAGYELLKGVGGWKFKVRRGGESVELDPAGVPFSGSDFTVRGAVIRVGLAFALTRQ